MNVSDFIPPALRSYSTVSKFCKLLQQVLDGIDEKLEKLLVMYDFDKCSVEDLLYLVHLLGAGEIVEIFRFAPYTPDGERSIRNLLKVLRLFYFAKGTKLGLRIPLAALGYQLMDLTEESDGTVYIDVGLGDHPLEEYCLLEPFLDYAENVNCEIIIRTYMKHFFSRVFEESDLRFDLDGIIIPENLYNYQRPYVGSFLVGRKHVGSVFENRRVTYEVETKS